jgi:hypothetical protein
MSTTIKLRGDRPVPELRAIVKKGVWGVRVDKDKDGYYYDLHGVNGDGNGRDADHYEIRCGSLEEATALRRRLREAGYDCDIDGYTYRDLPDEDFKDHPAAGLFPMMAEDELRDLAADIKKNGQREPIYVYKCQVLDGRNRRRACAVAGVRPYYEWLNAPDQDLDDPLAFVLSKNLHRRHLTAEQRREIVSRLLKDRPGRSNRQVASQVGVDHKTVGAVRKQLETTGEIPQLDKTEGKDGKARRRPARKPKSRPHARSGGGPPADFEPIRAEGDLVPIRPQAAGESPALRLDRPAPGEDCTLRVTGACAVADEKLSDEDVERAFRPLVTKLASIADRAGPGGLETMTLSLKGLVVELEARRQRSERGASVAEKLGPAAKRGK